MYTCMNKMICAYMNKKIQFNRQCHHLDENTIFFDRATSFYYKFDKRNSFPYITHIQKNTIIKKWPVQIFT